MFVVNIILNSRESSIQVFEEGFEIELRTSIFFFLLQLKMYSLSDLVACLYLSQLGEEMRSAKDSTKDSTAEGLFATSFHRIFFGKHTTLDFLQMPQSGGEIS